MTNRLTNTFLTNSPLVPLLALVASMLVAPLSAAYTTASQLEQRVGNEVSLLLKQHGITSRAGQRVAYQISPIDPRLRLADCDEAMAILIDPGKLLGRLTAKVECRGQSPWSIYVPVTVKLYKSIVTTRRPLARGALLERKNLQIREKEVSRLTQGYFVTTKALINKQLKRSLAINSVITPDAIIEPKAIKKGDSVMIVASSGTLKVRSPGIAMSDGRIGQQIRVKNSASKRVVNARVKQKGLVEVAI